MNKDEFVGKLCVCSVFDVAAQFFLAPFMVRTVDEAKRDFGDAIRYKDPRTGKGAPFALHPTEYCLFHHAYFDENTGTYINLPAPVSLGLAITYMQKSDQDGDKVVDLHGKQEVFQQDING